MLKQILTFLFLMIGWGFAAGAQESHSHHAKHNMIVFGESEVFASHIVYKEPHNFQVILSLSLPEPERTAYLDAKKEHPGDTFIYLLDQMDIKDIAQESVLRGKLFREDADSKSHDVIPNLRLARENWKLLYFDELPLSLAQSEKMRPLCTDPKPCVPKCRPGSMCKDGTCSPVF